MSWDIGAIESAIGGGIPGGGVDPPEEIPAPEPGASATPDLGVVASTPALRYRETYDILGAASIKGSRSTIDIVSSALTETFNTVDYRYAECYATHQFAGHGQHINEEDLAELGEEERTDLELKFVRDPTTARWAARQRARFFTLRSYDLEFSLDAPRNIDRIEIGDTIGIDYYGGIGGAWVNEPFFVYGIRYMLDELRYVIRARRIIPEEEVAEASSDVTIGRWAYNSRVGPFFESGSRSIFLVLLDTRVAGTKSLVVLRSTDLGATFDPAGTFTALANDIGSFDVHRVGTTLHVATQEAVTGRVAYHTFGLLTSEWTLLNQERYAGNAFGDYGVSITVRSGGGQLIWFQTARATITSTTWPAAPGDYKRTAATWRNPVDDTWSTPIEIGDPSSAASSFTGPHAYHGSVHDNVGRAAAGDNDVVRFVYGRTEPLDVASTPDFQVQRLSGANILGPNVEFQFTGLSGYSAQFVAGDYSVFRAPSMDSGGPVVTEPLCGCESCITTSPLPDTGGDLWIAVPIGYGMNPVIYFWRDSDTLDIPHHYAELSTTIVPQHVFEAIYPAIALRYIQGRLYGLFGDVGTNPTHAVLKNVISPFTTVDVDPPYASEPHDDQVGPDYPSPGFIQMVGMDMGEINGHLWLFHVSTAGGVGFHFESQQLN